MIEGIAEAVSAIHRWTGKRPKRIELEGGLFLVKINGVEVLVTASQYGQMYTRGMIFNDATDALPEESKK